MAVKGFESMYFYGGKKGQFLSTYNFKFRLGPECSAYGTFDRGFEMVGNREVAMSEAKGFLEFFQRKLFTDK